MSTAQHIEGRRTLSVEEAARELGISRALAYELVRTTGRLGGVSVVRLGRRIVVPRAALDRVLAMENPEPEGADYCGSA